MKKQRFLHKILMAFCFAAIVCIQFTWTDRASGETEVSEESIPQTQPRFAEDIEPHDGTTIVVVTPTPTPTPGDECEYFRGDIVDLGFSETRLDSYDRIFEKTGDAVGLQCLDAMIERAKAACQGGYLGITSTSNGIKHHDDCLAWEFASYMMPDWDTSGRWFRHKTGTHSNGSVCDRLHLADMGWCPSDSPVGFGFITQVGYKQCKPCAAGHFFFAEDPNNPDKCMVVQPGPDDEECGTFTLNYWRSTPISLVWTEDEELPATLSKFPLDPRKPNLWHVWKASKEFPLLVHDPKHQGRIVSARQLFGPWSFGGQAYASMSSGSLAPTPWKSGFEALATMDADGNGRIDGAELEELALWFDRNQDGVSDKGEVVPMLETGVVELSYGPAVSDDQGNLVVNLGFTRTLDGRVVTGKAVDWVTKGASSQFDLLSQYFTSSSDSTRKAQIAERAEQMPFAASPKEQQEPKRGEDELADYIGGAWQWAAVGEESNGARGFFVLTDNHKQVSGYSLLETPFRRKGSAEKRSYATMIYLIGSKKRDVEGRLHLDFELSGDTPKVVSKAILSTDLRTMEGHTTVTNAKDKISYRWVAKRR